jgi:hypothetical protein
MTGWIESPGGRGGEGEARVVFVVGIGEGGSTKQYRKVILFGRVGKCGLWRKPRGRGGGGVFAGMFDFSKDIWTAVGS